MCYVFCRNIPSVKKHLESYMPEIVLFICLRNIFTYQTFYYSIKSETVQSLISTSIPFHCFKTTFCLQHVGWKRSRRWLITWLNFQSGFRVPVALVKWGCLCQWLWVFVCNESILVLFFIQVLKISLLWIYCKFNNQAYLFYHLLCKYTIRKICIVWSLTLVFRIGMKFKSSFLVRIFSFTYKLFCLSILYLKVD